MPRKPCNTRCSGCAYTDGSEANLEPKNFLTAQLAVLGPFPFYCHSNLDWENEHCGKKTRAEFKEKNFQLCAGWLEEVKALAATGYYKEGAMVTKCFAQVSSENLEIFLSSEPGEDKDEAFATMQRTLERLVEKRRKFERVARQIVRAEEVALSGVI